jgi:2-polyprenyl-6-methoxyphenol hydroxylase-like FAD-dependent oxidoreductase
MQDEIYDLVQVGMGPVGLTMAALTAQAGHTIAVVERHEGLFGLPRAGHIDHEIVRILQSLDCERPVLADSYPTLDYVWVNGEGETLLEFDRGAKAVSGYNSDYMQHQPVLEEALASRVRSEPSVTVLNGWEAVAFHEHDDHVEVVMRKTVLEPGNPRPVVTDEERVLRGRYLIGADGASSTVRRWLGIERSDLGFNERWLDVDARMKRPLTSGIFAGQGIRQAGKAGTVKMVGAEGDPNGIEGVQNGGQAVDLATVPPWGGWAAVDLLVRHMAGSPVETAELPQRLFDKSNVPSGKGWSGDVDYTAAYKELWGR